MCVLVLGHVTAKQRIFATEDSKLAQCTIYDYNNLGFQACQLDYRTSQYVGPVGSDFVSMNPFFLMSKVDTVAETGNEAQDKI